MTYVAADRSIAELLEDWAAVMRELRRRDVVRTNNNPAGDIAEAIVAAHYGGERGSFSEKGWDVKTTDGERVQVKAIRVTVENSGRRRNLSPIRDADYDTVVVVILDDGFRVTEGLRFSRAVVEELFPHREYINGRVITLTRKLQDHPDVERVDLSDAYTRLGAA